MRVVFLPSAVADLAWWRHYYTQAFPAGQPSAGARFQQSLESIESNPEIGRLIDTADVRIFQISRTPFSILYRLKQDRIEVLRIRDGRSGEPKR